MSKSLGNLYTLEDVAKRGYEPADLRLVLLSGHYRQPLNFSWDTMQAARHGREKLGRVHAGLAETAAGKKVAKAGWGSFGLAWEALRDDLETPKVLGALYTAAAEVDRKRRQGMKAEEAAEELAGMDRILGVLGVAPYFEKDVEVPEEVRKLAEAREAARKAKEWKESDRLRDELVKVGWEVRDGAGGWRLVRKAGVP
jgi:cysteinyl-tRNA synthetase